MKNEKSQKCLQSVDGQALHVEKNDPSNLYPAEQEDSQVTVFTSPEATWRTAVPKQAPHFDAVSHLAPKSKLDFKFILNQCPTISNSTGASAILIPIWKRVQSPGWT